MLDQLFDFAARLNWTVAGWVIVLVFVLYMYVSMFRIVGEYERLAVFFHGRFQQFKGPGIVVSLPTHQQSYRVPIGTQGVLMANDVARFDGVDLPVRRKEDLSLGAKVQITGFDEYAAVVELATSVSKHRCPECGHEFI